MLETSLTVFIFTLLGFAVGSFLNLCIDRLPLDQSIVRPQSHCPDCGKRVSAIDLVPVLNYLWLRGRCRNCGSRIPLRLPLVEAATGAVFGLLTWHYGLGPELGVSLVFASFMMVIIFIDLDHQLILNVVVYPGIVVALVLAVVRQEFGVDGDGFLVQSLIGGAIGLVLLGLPYILYSKGMGLGDVKLALMIGLMLGYPLVFVGLLLAIVAGGLMAAALLILRLKRRREAIPFGPFLAVAAMVTIVFGSSIKDWYLGLFERPLL